VDDPGDTYMVAVAEYTGTFGLSTAKYVRMKQSRKARKIIHAWRRSRRAIALRSMGSFIFLFPFVSQER